MTVVSKKFLMNSGKIMNADVGSDQDTKASIVIALTPENKVIIARQFRCGPEKIMDELPGGVVDPGETPEQSARRELREEVGYDTDALEYIGKSYVNAWDNREHYHYLARNCYKVDAGNSEEFEEIEVDTISIEQLFENAKNATMTDVQAVLFAHDTLTELRGKS